MTLSALCFPIKRTPPPKRALCRRCTAAATSWTMLPLCSLIGERERSRRCSSGPAVRGEVEPAKGFHPWQGAIQTGRLARRLVDLPPVEKHRGCSKSSNTAFSGPTTQRGPPRSRWTTMHMEKMLPLTHGCSWFARKTRLRPRTRDSEWLHVGGFGTRYSVVYVAVIAAVV